MYSYLTYIVSIYIPSSIHLPSSIFPYNPPALGDALASAFGEALGAPLGEALGAALGEASGACDPLPNRKIWKDGRLPTTHFYQGKHGFLLYNFSRGGCFFWLKKQLFFFKRFIYIIPKNTWKNW